MKLSGGNKGSNRTCKFEYLRTPGTRDKFTNPTPQKSRSREGNLIKRKWFRLDTCFPKQNKDLRRPSQMMGLCLNNQDSKCRQGQDSNG